ncbi:MAG: hypothetical protein ACI93P_001242, partial [bacterium]
LIIKTLPHEKYYFTFCFTILFFMSFTSTGKIR